MSVCWTREFDTYPPCIVHAQLPAYQGGYAECGIGSHARRKALMEGHVHTHRVNMFKEAIKPISQVRKRVGCMPLV
jgi:hypothetical protein